MSQFSRRALIMRFASLVARCFNAGEKTTDVDPAALYTELLDILSGERGPQSRLYSAHLAGHSLVASRSTPEEAAQVYFDRVIDRKLFLARDNPHHKGHELFLALWRRSSAKGWADCTLLRTLDEAPVPLRKPEGFAVLDTDMRGISRDISEGNPAATTCKNRGALFLYASGARLELPEELSLWGAMKLSPASLVSVEGEAWLGFRNLFIQAFETANSPYASLLSVGLWPADWENELSTHQAKQLSAFLSEVRQGDDHELAGWSRVWERGRRVSGFKSADELWQSELGYALRAGPVRAVFAVAIEGLAETPDDDEEEFSSAEFRKRLRLCRDGGVIDELEEWLYLRLEAGCDAAELAQEAAMKARLKSARLSMAAYLEAVSVRVHAFVRQLDESIPIKG